MSLIEVMVWIGMFTMAMIAISSTVISVYRTNRYAFEQAQTVASAQKGLNEVVRTVRESVYSSQGAFPVVSIAANDFVFYADIDTDPLIEKVHFSISGTKLMRGVTEASGNPPDYTGAEIVSERAEYVRNATQGVTTFRYYDELGSEITNYTNWSAVRFVKVTLVVDADTTRLPAQLTLTSSAAIRNLLGH